MSKKKSKKRKIKKILKTTIFVILAIILAISIKIYLNHVDKVTMEIENTKNHVFTSTNHKENENGFSIAFVQNDMIDYLGKQKTEKDQVIYKIEKEKFYLDITVKLEDGRYKVDIDRVIDDKHEISARVNYRNVSKIEYKTGNLNDTTVIKIFYEDTYEFVAIVNRSYYVVGSDINDIKYEDDHFYYVNYNPKYLTLNTYETCKDAQKGISGFSYYDYYYKYGKINFLADYYQKFPSNNLSIKNACEKMENTGN